MYLCYILSILNKVGETGIFGLGCILLIDQKPWRHRSRSIEDGNCAEAEAPCRRLEIAALVGPKRVFPSSTRMLCAFAPPLSQIMMVITVIIMVAQFRTDIYLTASAVIGVARTR